VDDPTLERVIQELQEDFRNFLAYIWPYLNIPSPEPTNLQYDMAYFLQHGANQKILEAFRGAAKSTITCCYVVWRLWRDPEDKFLIVSSTHDLAKRNARFIKRVISSVPLLAPLKPCREREQMDSMIEFDIGTSAVSLTRSVKCAGIFGSITGYRGEVIADDIENDKNSLTADMRLRLITSCAEFISITSETSRITYLGTPQTSESIYNTLREQGFEVSVWPARYPSDVDVYEGTLARDLMEDLENDPLLVGTPTDPEHFDDETLLKKESSVSRSYWQLHFMLNTSLSDALRFPLKIYDLMCMDLDAHRAPITMQYASSRELQLDFPQVSPNAGDRFYRPMFVDTQYTAYNGSIMTVDPGGLGDETAYAIVKTLHGRFFLLASGGFRNMPYDLQYFNIAELAKEFGVDAILVEKNNAGDVYNNSLKAVLNTVYPCKVENPVWHSTNKVARIVDTLEPVLNSHKLVVDVKVIKADIEAYSRNPEFSLFYQLSHISKIKNSLKHDDRLDVLAMAIDHFNKILLVDPALAKKRYEQEQFRKKLDELFGRVDARAKWIHERGLSNGRK
jgi:hypothetical protein